MAYSFKNRRHKWFQQPFSRGRRTEQSRSNSSGLSFELMEERVVLSVTWPSYNGDGTYSAPILSANWGDFSILPGDYNSDGVANGRDFLVWQRQVSSIVPPLSGADGDGNGQVGEGDLQVWQHSYGQTTGSPWIELRWDALAGASSYNIKRANTSGGPYTTIATGIAGTSFNDTGLAIDGDYHYVVSGIGSFGESLNSNVAMAAMLLQAEDATHAGVVVANSESGYNGDGYAQFVTASGSYIEWNVDAAQAGLHQLTFRYSLAGATPRPLALAVNGGSINPSVEFSSTGSGSTWQEVAVTTAFVKGSNTIRLTSIGSGGANFDQLTVSPLDPVENPLSKLRRPISPEQPMWLIHIDTWNYADPQKIIDLIPADIRPYVVMNISLSISHNAETSQFQVAEYGYEIAKSWLRVCAENQMWAIVQHSSGGFAQFSDFDLSVYEEFYREFPNLIGFSYAEQFWGYDDPNDPLSPRWTDRIDHFANLLELSHQYGGYLVVSWCGNQFSENINPIAMLKRNPDFAEASRLYTENYILFEKYTTQTYQNDMESLTLGAYLSGYSGNYGIRYDETGWTDALGIHDNFTLVTGAAPQLEHAMLTGQTVIDGPELIWQQNFDETDRIPAGDGFTQRNWETFPQFDNVSIDLFRKVLDGTVRIPTREEVIERTQVVVVNDIDVGSASTIYSSPQTLFEGLYQMDGNYANNRSFFKSTGRYPTIPTVFDLDDDLANSFELQVNRSDYDTRWPTIAAKVNELNSLFPAEYTGDLYAGRHENGWVTYNPFKTGQTASASIPFKYNTSDRMELTYSQYTTGIVKEHADSISFYLNNYDNVLDTSLKTDIIKIYGSTSQPTWSYADRGEHQSSIVTSDWTGGVFTLTVQHNGALDITVNASGTATNRLTDYTPATIVAPELPIAYTGPLQREGEVFDYKNIAGVTTAGNTGSVRNYTGQGYLRFGTSSTAAVRDTVTVLKDGNYQLQTRYAVTGANISTINLYVNGVNRGTPVFTQTASLSSWAVNTMNIPLEEGENTIEFRATAAAPAGTNLHLDNFVVVPTVYGDGMIIQENGIGFAGVDGTINNNQAGYTGAGFADTDDVVGAGIDWALNLDYSRVKSFTFRYAGTADRTANLIVNDEVVASNIQLRSTGSLSNWGYSTVYASVPAGYSTVRLQSTSASGLSNIDSLEVFGAIPWSPGTSPFTPVGLSATPVSTSQLDLDWFATPGADSYNVMRATSSGGPYTTIATGVTGTSYNDTGLSELTTYYYAVSANNANGQSANSTETSVTTLTTLTPAAPMGVGAAAMAFDKIHLSWTASAGADSYIVKRSISSGGPYITVAIDVTGTSFTDSGLFGATTFYYVVSAVNGVGKGVNSSQVSASTLSTAILSPVADTFVRDGGSVSTNFGTDSTLVVKNDGGTGFNRNAFLKFDVSGLADALSATLTLTPFQVDQSSVVLSYELVADDSWSESTMTWNNQPAGSGTVIANVNGFVVGQPKVTDVLSAMTSQAATDGIFSLKLSAPTVGNNFTGFHSKEVTSSGLQPVLMANLTHIAYPPPAVPTNLVAAGAAADQINLSWTAASGATRYNISRSSVSGGPYTLIAAGVPGNSYSDTGLQEGATYYYVVSAINGTGQSANSTEAGANAVEPQLYFQESGGILSMEAEHGTVGNRWETVVNATASGGEYIRVLTGFNQTGATPTNTTVDSIATYDFNVSTTGDYRFWFRTYAPSANDDSFFWRVDNGGWISENNRGGTGAWHSTDNIQVNSLSAGAHVLQIAYREDGSGLDKFVIQLDNLAAPTDTGPAESIIAPLGELAAMAASTNESDLPSTFFITMPVAAQPTVTEAASKEMEPISQLSELEDGDESQVFKRRAYAAGPQTELAPASSEKSLLRWEQEYGMWDWLDDLAVNLASDFRTFESNS
jgi:fibronectin type 3 domain-containing protein